MKTSKTSEIQLHGCDLVKFLHVFIQIIFLPIAAVRLQHNFQIMVPLPVGLFIILSIFCNLVVYIPHLLEYHLNRIISLDGNQISIETLKFRKSKSTKYEYSKTSIRSGKIHESFGWIFIFMLGLAWNLYLTSEGLKLLTVKAFYQGLPMFFYGLLTEILYLLMFFLPDREILLFNSENPKKSLLILIPSIILSCKMKLLYSRNSIFSKIDSLLEIESEREPISITSYFKNNWVQIFQLFTWLVVWIFGATITFDFYHYQFVGAFDFIILAFYIRNILYKKNQSNRNPWWIYPFWILTFHEVGIKFWHVIALGVLSPSSIIWTFPVASILFILVLTSTVMEIHKLAISNRMKNEKWIIIWIIFLVELGLQFTALFSTVRIIPFYFSLIEIGPLI